MATVQEATAVEMAQSDKSASVTSAEGSEAFLVELTHHVQRRVEEHNAVSARYILKLLTRDFANTNTCNNNIDRERYRNGLIDAIQYCSFEDCKTLCSLFDSLRKGALSNNPASSTKNSGANRVGVATTPIPVAYHPRLLAVLERKITDDNPPHIRLPGDRDSFLKTTSITVPYAASNSPGAKAAYSVAIWVKIHSASVSKGFILYRVRSPLKPNVGMDVILSDPRHDGTLTISFRGNTEKKGKDELQKSICIPYDSWHLVTVQQSISATVTGNAGERILVSVDGEMALDEEFKYPFSSPTPESSWVFGLGFKGLISAASVYADDLPPNIVQLIYNAGPRTAEVTEGELLLL